MRLPTFLHIIPLRFNELKIICSFALNICEKCHSWQNKITTKHNLVLLCRWHDTSWVESPAAPSVGPTVLAMQFDVEENWKWKLRVRRLQWLVNWCDEAGEDSLLQRIHFVDLVVYFGDTYQQPVRRALAEARWLGKCTDGRGINKNRGLCCWQQRRGGGE